MHFLQRSLILFALFLLSTAVLAAEDFVLPDIHGVTHRLSDYRGKWVLVNYWATWCSPCLEEIPDLEEFHTRHQGKDVVVLGVDMEDIDLKTLREFVDEHFITYPILIGNSRDESPLGPIRGLPTSYLISPEGEIAATHLGKVSGEAIEGYINRKRKLPEQKADQASRPGTAKNTTAGLPHN